MISEHVRAVIDKAIAKVIEPSQPNHCHFCTKEAVASYTLREGEIPAGWDRDPKNNPDRSTVRVIKVCAAHKEQVPR